MQVKTTDLWDQFENEVQVAEPVFRNFGGRDSFWGRAVCLQVFEDNVLVRRELETDGKGKVLVVDGGGSMKCALLGDILAGLAISNHWSGIIIHGCIRDAKEIAAMPVGVKALNTSPRKSGKQGLGEREVIVAFAGVTIDPGNYVYADLDGILVAKRNLLNA
jgi:regulator of ribonuclease activity A